MSVIAYSIFKALREWLTLKKKNSKKKLAIASMVDNARGQVELK